MIIAGIDPSINGSGIYKLKLDKDLEVVDYDYLAFTNVKKNSTDNIRFYRTGKKSDFANYIEKNKWIYSHIISFVKECDYVSMEDYAYSGTGLVFDIAEFVGGLKTQMYDNDIKFKLYEPTVIKMFATSDGKSDKVSMDDSYHNKYTSTKDYYFKNYKGKDKADLSFLNEYKSPRTDIIDSYFMAKLLQIELKLRKGFIQIRDLDCITISIFNRVTKNKQVNILSEDFLYKE